jgi:hypothetical protein
LRFFQDRFCFSQSARLQEKEYPQWQSILKIAVFRNAFARLGTDPAGWNAGAGFPFTASSQKGMLEYYLGQGLYHHIYFSLQIPNKTKIATGE